MRQSGQYALLRIRIMIAVLAIALVSCGSKHAKPLSVSRVPVVTPVAILQTAARLSFETSSVALHGVMTAQGADQVLLSGRADLADHRVSITFAPSAGVATYPPYDGRFVAGWNYIEIDAAVHRPPTVHANTKWIAFQGGVPGLLPVPDRATAPETPLQTIEMLLTKPIASAQFADGPGTNSRRVSVRFRDEPFNTTKYTFSIDASGRVAAIAILDRYDQGITLDFAYGPSVGAIVAPSAGVQRLSPGEHLYPTTTTPTA